MYMSNSKHNDVFRMALISIFLVLSVAIIYFGSVIDIFEGVAVILSSLLTVIAYEECSKRYNQ